MWVNVLGAALNPGHSLRVSPCISAVISNNVNLKAKLKLNLKPKT